MTNIEQKSGSAGVHRRKVSMKKPVLTAMFSCLAFVLSTFVYFPSMAPFQHFVDVLAAALLGPWYGCAAAFLCGILRMILSGRTIQAISGAVFGPVLGGLLYRKLHNIWAVVIGEILGTGIVGALVSYPLMRTFYGLDTQVWYYYVPFYAPSAVVGAGTGAAVWMMLRKMGVWKWMVEQVNE